MHLILIGPRAAGKTTVGHLLAARLRRVFHDLDDCVLRRLGLASVRDVFSRHGESVWRAGEHAALASLLDAPLAPAVIALGGGAPMTEGVATTLHDGRRSGRLIVAHLACSAETSAARLAMAPGDRPSLTGQPIADELAGLAVRREPRYRALADLTIDAVGTPDAVVTAVLDGIRPLLLRT